MAPRAGFLDAFLPNQNRGVAAGVAAGVARGVKKDKPKSKDREDDPDVQRARALNQYAFNLVTVIRNDYQKQIGEWNKAFSHVISAFATAVNERNETKQAAAAERQRDAAIAGFVLGLLTAGAMRFLGAYLQYTVIPRIKLPQAPHPTKGPFPWIQLPQGPAVTPFEFSRAQAAAMGGIAQDIGNRVVSLTFPKPSNKSYAIDSWSGVDNLRSDFLKLLSDSADVVLTQFDTTLTWLTDSTEFGEAWAAQTMGNGEQARQRILSHIVTLREKWAKDWEFFGTTPQLVPRELLARHFERALWAFYISAVVAQGLADGDIIKTWDNDYYVRTKLIEAAIVERLAELNVVVATSTEGQVAQMTRVGTSGDPAPSATVHGAVNYGYEVLSLEKWYQTFLPHATKTTMQQFFPPARKRALPPLSSR